MYLDVLNVLNNRQWNFLSAKKKLPLTVDYKIIYKHTCQIPKLSVLIVKT